MISLSRHYREAITVLLLKDSPYNTLADMAGKGITVSALQNPHIEDVAHEGIPDAVVEQFDSVANTALALDAGRVDAMLADFSTAQWLTAQNPDKYKYPRNRGPFTTMAPRSLPATRTGSASSTRSSST